LLSSENAPSTSHPNPDTSKPQFESDAKPVDDVLFEKMDKEEKADSPNEVDDRDDDSSEDTLREKLKQLVIVNEFSDRQAKAFIDFLRNELGHVELPKSVAELKL
jgi:hypothetical protein